MNPLDCSICVNEIIELLNARASEKSINLSYETNPDVPPWIFGDITFSPDRDQFIGNAIKFTENGSVTITSKATPLSDDFHEFQFSVEDTGLEF